MVVGGRSADDRQGRVSTSSFLAVTGKEENGNEMDLIPSYEMELCLPLLMVEVIRDSKVLPHTHHLICPFFSPDQVPQLGCCH